MTPSLVSLLRQTRRRLRVQRWLQGAVYGAVVGSFLVTVALFGAKLGAVRPAGLLASLAVGGLVALVVAALWGLRPLPAPAVARYIDRAHDSHDRLSTALEFARSGETTAFISAHMAQTERELAHLAARDVYPLRRPTAIWLLVAHLGCLGVVSSLRFSPSRASGPSRQPGRSQAAQIEPSELSRHASLAQQLQGSSPAHLGEFADELNRLIEQVQQQQLTREQIFSRLAALDELLDAGRRDDWRSIEARLQQLAQRLQRRPPTKRLGDALRGPDLQRAAQEVSRLAERLQRLSDPQRRRLARSLRDAAQESPEARRLQDRAERLKRRVRRLKRQQLRRPQARRTQRRLRRAERQLQRLNQRQRALQSEGRQLKRLNHSLTQASARLRGGSNERARRGLNELAEQLRKLAPTADNARAAARAHEQITELKELLRRLAPARKRRLARLRRFQLRARGSAEKRSKDNDRGFVLMPRGGRSGSRVVVSRREDPRGLAASERLRQSAGRPGSGSDPRVLGSKTKLAEGGRIEQLPGVEREGPTSSEVIQAAAQREGFSARGYSRVYRSYHDASIDDIRREDVPLGRRRLVKWYFDLIKPAER